ncbi:MAG TPA: phosphatase PAP2 family protein [Planctomycetaceae bacterium]|nr:phosphatase PAP2 family protein [Planctomycetaceae bacterium]
MQVGASDENDQSTAPGESWFPGRELSRRPGILEQELNSGSNFARGIGSSIGDDPHARLGENDQPASFDAELGDAQAAPGNEPAIDFSNDDCSELCECRSISFKDDIWGIPSMLWNDNLSLFNWKNAIILGAAAGGSVAVRDNLDMRVRRETAEHSLRWGEGSVVLRQFGEYTVQVPVLAGVYGLSLWSGDDRLHEFSKAAISAYSLSAMYTVTIKGITNTQRPTNQFENGHYGFPSYHASSTFSLAAVVEQYYGWQAGVPAYVLAGLVGWSRIDQREHDLSDVLFGSVLGWVIGRTVAAAHLNQTPNLRITPFYDASNRTSGVSVDAKF